MDEEDNKCGQEVDTPSDNWRVTPSDNWRVKLGAPITPESCTPNRQRAISDRFGDTLYHDYITKHVCMQRLGCGRKGDLQDWQAEWS